MRLCKKPISKYVCTCGLQHKYSLNLIFIIGYPSGYTETGTTCDYKIEKMKSGKSYVYMDIIYL